MSGYGLPMSAGSGAIAPGRRGKSAKGDKVPDLSQYMEEFCSQAKTVPAEVVRSFNLLKQLDEKVHAAKEKIAADSNVYSAAKNKHSEEMKKLKAGIDESQKSCLEWAEEKVNLAQQCLQQIGAKLRTLDDDLAELDELMLQQQAQGEEEEAEAAGSNAQKSSRDRERERERERKRKATPAVTWLEEGHFVEVEWDGEWWQAKIKKIKYRTGGSGAMGGGTDRNTVRNSTGQQVISVFVEYVGGQEEENEWIQMASDRLRAPSETFHEQPAEPEISTPFDMNPYASPYVAGGTGGYGRSTGGGGYGRSGGGGYAPGAYLQ